MTDEDIYISPGILAVHAIERAAIEVEAALNGKPDRWWFAITDAHQALTAALVETLRGTEGIGAYAMELQNNWLNYFEASRTNPDARSPKEGYILPFEDLLKRAQGIDSMHDVGGTLTLTDQCKKDLRQLNHFRNELHHVKPQGWYLQIVGLPRILGAAAEAMHQLFNVYPLNGLEDDAIKRADKAITALQRLTWPTPSGL